MSLMHTPHGGCLINSTHVHIPHENILSDKDVALDYALFSSEHLRFTVNHNKKKNIFTLMTVAHISDVLTCTEAVTKSLQNSTKTCHISYRFNIPPTPTNTCCGTCGFLRSKMVFKTTANIHRIQLL